MKPDSPFLDRVVIGCLFHAGLITVLWLLAFKFEIIVLPGKIWMMLAISWLLWGVVYLLSSREVLKRRAIVGLVGILILAPTVPTLYTFIVWTAQGFAP